MKTILLAATFVLSATLSPAADTPAPCCPPVAPAKPACCVETPSAAGGGTTLIPLTARSLYQIEATWTTDEGSKLALTALRGGPVILAMFFAQCEYACPIIVNDIKRLQAALPEDVRANTRVVLVTFDTVRDTPAALKAFRERMSLDAKWTLLRSEAGSVQELAMLLGVKFKQDTRGQFAHSNIITVLNREGEIVHQLAGLNADISETARVLAAIGVPVAVR